MFRVKMYTHVGFAGAYCETLDLAKQYANSIQYYYCIVMDSSTGEVLFDDTKPYFVRNAVLLTDNYTGEKFWASRTYHTREEAEQNCHYCKVVELRDRMDYLNL